MEDLDKWEDEGGFVPLSACLVCGKMKHIYEDGLCLPCWLKVNPIHGGIDV